MLLSHRYPPIPRNPKLISNWKRGIHPLSSIFYFFFFLLASVSPNPLVSTVLPSCRDPLVALGFCFFVSNTSVNRLSNWILTKKGGSRPSLAPCDSATPVTPLSSLGEISLKGS